MTCNGNNDDVISPTCHVMPRHQYTFYASHNSLMVKVPSLQPDALLHVAADPLVQPLAGLGGERAPFVRGVVR